MGPSLKKSPKPFPRPNSSLLPWCHVGYRATLNRFAESKSGSWVVGYSPSLKLRRTSK